MANISPEREALTDLMARTAPERHERFDPTTVSVVRREGAPDRDSQFFLKGTTSLTAVPHVGPLTVAIFQEFPPAVEPGATEGILHRSCDEGVLLRRPSSEEEVHEAEQLGEPRGLGPKHAWVFERLLLVPEAPDTLVTAGPDSEPAVFLPSA
jgi:hypothetical protein